MSSWSNKVHFRERKTFINDAIVCAIALNEELYIDEWIKYNLALGFSHIYIYFLLLLHNNSMRLLGS